MQKTAIITGGSGGIGMACARRLLEGGHRVVLAARGLEGLERAARAFDPQQVRTVAADAGDAGDVARLMEATLQWSGRIDVLVNNAGAACTGTVETFADEQWHRLLHCNLTSVFMSCRAVVPIMKQQGGGHIVNVASVASKFTPPEWGPYCATKFALVGLTRCLHEEVRKDGIRVTLLYPGGVDTALWDTFPNDFDRRRMLRPDDVARALVYTLEQPSDIVVDEVSLIWATGMQ